MPSLRKTYSEEEILAGCRRNERKYQELLYRRHFDTMTRMIRRFTQDDERVLDILNNGMLRVFQKIESYSGTGSLEGWIRRIVYHSISDYFKKESRYLRFIVLEDKDKEYASSALDDLYYTDLLAMVEDLPEKSREVFKLYAIEGYSHKEIADMLQISTGTSKWHLSNARDQLKQIIHQRMDQNYAG
ncbi:MAG: sigma-70 family RNA polymerase sigma factor [Saprospiraceae bacterium]|nr:sigma-70 family RNA polymerase sigma factor [Saprospiraceae bacterium]